METAPLTQVKVSRKALLMHYEGFLRSLRNKRPETQGTYQRALREFLRWFQQDGKCRFRTEDVERYKLHLTKRKHLSDVSVSTYLTSVRRFCGFLVQSGVLKGNPASQVNGNSRPSGHSREVLTITDVDRLLGVIGRGDERGKRDFAIIKLMVGCALSEIEVIRADIKDLEDRRSESVLAVQGKGRISKDEHVVLPSDVKGAIDDYLASRKSVAPDSPLFASAGNRTRGARMTTRGVRDRVNSYLELAGIKRGRLRKVTPYSLRHTAAMMMAGAGASVDEIRRKMRLGSEATAMLYIQQQQKTA